MSANAHARTEAAETVRIADNALDVQLPIPGLRFEPNLVSELKSIDGWFDKKLMSSPGPLVSDFVTHEVDFHYNTYGIHVGQVDRLTFMGNSANPILGHFIDCRLGSPALHTRVSIEYSPSLQRRLIVPQGVAHTFDNLAGIVTRDEPVWHADFDNIDWDVNNDLVSIPRSMPEESYPSVKPNQLRMPDDIHRFVSRISQELLKTPTAYASRHLLNIAGRDTYVSFQSRTWTENEAEIADLLSLEVPPGATVTKSRYALTGPRSWTLVPNTGSCVADVLELPGRADRSHNHFLHYRTRKWYTFLTNPGGHVDVTLVDWRPNASVRGEPQHLRMKADPRVTLIIEPGVAYSLESDSDLLVRCEHEVFVAADEPREDLPPFGQDLLVLGERETPEIPAELPHLRLPDEVVCGFARQEQEVTMGV